MPATTIYRIERWEGKTAPTLLQLERIMRLEAPGFACRLEDLPASQPSGEQRFDYPIMICLVAGRVEVAFPGYTVLALHPGDLLSVDPNVRLEWTVALGKPASWLWVAIDGLPE